MRYGFGVDIFGSNIKFGFFDETGRLIDKWKIGTPLLRDGNQIIPSVAEEIDRYMKKHTVYDDDIMGIGVGIPGPVNSSGVVNKCVNLGWGVFNMDRALSGLTGFPVRSSNIANLSALGECWKGSGSDNMVFMALNIGLGGGIVCEGRLVNGANGGAGEIGHIIVNKKETEPCTCGRYGCVEQYCSQMGIMRLARRQLSTTRYLSSLHHKNFFNYKDVLKAAEDGDKVAKDVMAQVYDHAGHALASVCCVTNPDTIVLGGEFCKIGQPSMDAIARAFRKYVFHANENVRFEFAKLDTDACIHGAFKLVLDSYGKE